MNQTVMEIKFYAVVQHDGEELGQEGEERVYKKARRALSEIVNPTREDEGIVRIADLYVR